MGQPQIRKAAQDRLVLYLSKGKISEGMAVIKLNLLTPEELQSDEVRSAARIELVKSLSEAEIRGAKTVISLNLLTPEDLRHAAQDGLVKCLSTGRSDRVKEVINLNLLTSEEIQTPEIRNALRTHLVECLSNGRLNVAKDYINLNLLVPEDLQTPEIRKAAQDRLVIYLSKGEISEGMAVIKLNLLTPEELQRDEVRSAARIGLVKSLSEAEIRDAKTVISLNLLTPEDLRSVARIELVKGLSDGEISKASGIIKLNLLTPEEVQTGEIRDAARTGLIKCLSSSEGSFDVQRIIDLNLLTAADLQGDEIRKAARIGLVQGLANGGDATFEKITELNLLTPEELQTDEIRNAARIGLVKCLSQGEIDYVIKFINLAKLKEDEIDTACKQCIEDGHITAVIQFALSRNQKLDSVLSRYLDIAKLTEDSAKQLFQQLSQKDPSWNDGQNIFFPFERGAAIFGTHRMLRYIFKANASAHDALYSFDDTIKLFHLSNLPPQIFAQNILFQVNMDDALDDTGNAFSRLNQIAHNFPKTADDINSVLLKAAEYKDIQILQELCSSFLDQQSIFASWQSLQRFAKLQHLLAQTEVLPHLQELRQSGNTKLADWIETLAFHPNSKVSVDSLLAFWQAPESFLDVAEIHAPESHELKKPSNYVQIPHLDLTANELRDALVSGTLDRLQVFTPRTAMYQIGNSESLSSELARALGSRQKDIKGDARNATKLYSEVQKLLKPAGISLDKILNGTPVPEDLKTELENVIYDAKYGAQRPQQKPRFVVEIHRKGDPLAVVAGDDTACCMSFGTGKNNVYMFNLNCAIMTVRLLREDGTQRTIAQSLLTKDRDVKVSFPTILQKMQDNEQHALHTIIPVEALSSSKAVIAADNIEVHPNYQTSDYDKIIEELYRDFFARYLAENTENLQNDQIIIGLGHSDAMQSLPKIPNTFVPQAPVGYTDKSHSEVHSLSLAPSQSTPVTLLKMEADSPIPGRILPQSAVTPGITALTFEDTLSVGYIESKAFADSPTLREGLHNMENGLIAVAINNTAKERPNLSLKYVDNNGKMKGYLFAYEARGQVDNTTDLEGIDDIADNEQPFVYISDFAFDRPIGDSGSPIPTASAGKLLLEFGNLYKENYLDKGQLMPIYASARDKTSYKLITRQLESLGQRFGYTFKIRELGAHQSGDNTMHDVLIVPVKNDATLPSVKQQARQQRRQERY